MFSSPWTIWLFGLPAVILVAGLVHYSGHGPFIGLTETLHKVVELEDELEHLEKQNTELQERVEGLMPGEFGVHKNAREKLGYSLPGEIVVQIPNKQ